MVERIPWSPAPTGRPTSIGGGEASGFEIFGAALEQMRLVDNTTAAGDALTEAYEDWRRDIKAATGVEPPVNPMTVPSVRTMPRPGGMPGGGAARTEDPQTEARRRFQIWVNDQAQRYPAEAVRDWAQRDPVQYAEQLARGADENLARLMESKPGWDKYLAAFGGGAIGSLRDPLTVGSLAFGGGPGAARTVGGRILNVAVKEALINAATEAAAQPAVQDWRRQAGLSSGFDEAVANIAFAAGFGGVLGAGGRGIYEGGAYAVGRRQLLDEGARLALEDPNLTQMAREALGGDYVRTAELMASLRNGLPAEVRGAIDEAQRIAELDRMKPEAISARRNEDLVARAEILAQRQQLPVGLPDDEVQISRIVNALAPAPESITARAGALPAASEDLDQLIARMRGEIEIETGAPTRPVSNFVRALGGVDPASPLGQELAARGVTSRTHPGLFSRRGLPGLDNIPIDELPDDLRAFSALDDGNGYVREQVFIDQIEAEGRARRQVDDSLGDQKRYLERQGVDFENMPDEEIKARLEAIADAERRYAATEPDNDLGLETDESVLLPPGLTRRAYTDQVVRDAIRLAGPGVDDDVIKAAVNLHLFEGEAIADAVEHALAEAAGTPRNLPAPARPEIGSSPPEPAGLDNPAQAVPELDADLARELEDLGDDFEIPFGDGVTTVAAMRAEIEQAQRLERVVAACGV